MPFEVAWIKVLLVSVLVYMGDCDETDELVMVNLVYRHGARSPIYIYKNDPYRSHWPDGTGRLTQNGMKMEYDLGRYLETEYVETDFVNKSYLHKEVSIRSSGVDRCLQSAQSQLAGLYPPAGWQIWNTDIAWQPIPVQTVPSDQDPLLRPENTKDCPAYHELITKMKEDSDEYKKRVIDSENLVKYLRVNSGEKRLTINNQWVINDCVKAETAEGLEQPDWIKERLPEIQDLSWFLFQFSYIGQPGTADLLGRLTGGTLLGKMIENMKSFGTDDVAPKLNLFSGHDTSILSLSTALGITIEKELPFSAMAIVELRKTSSGLYYVTMKYHHGNMTSYTPWKLSDCDFKCPLDDFVSKTKARVPTDRAVDCHSTPHQLPTAQPKHVITYKRLLVISIVLFVLVLSMFALLAVRCVCDNRWNKKLTQMMLREGEIQKEALIS